MIAGAATPTAEIGRREPDHGDGHRHQSDDHQQRGLAPFAIGIDAEHDAADGAHEKADTECCKREHQRGVLAVSGKKQFRDDHREEAEDQEVIPFQRVADDGCGDLVGLRRCLRGRHWYPLLALSPLVCGAIRQPPRLCEPPCSEKQAGVGPISQKPELLTSCRIYSGEWYSARFVPAAVGRSVHVVSAMLPI